MIPVSADAPRVTTGRSEGMLGRSSCRADVVGPADGRQPLVDGRWRWPFHQNQDSGSSPCRLRVEADNEARLGLTVLVGSPVFDQAREGCSLGRGVMLMWMYPCRRHRPEPRRVASAGSRWCIRSRCRKGRQWSR